MAFWRRKPQLRTIDETQAYARAYGGPREEVRRIVLPPRRPRDTSVLEHGELLRRAFLDRLERREEDKDDQDERLGGA